MFSGKDSLYPQLVIYSFLKKNHLLSVPHWVICITPPHYHTLYLSWGTSILVDDLLHQEGIETTWQSILICLMSWLKMYLSLIYSWFYRWVCTCLHHWSIFLLPFLFVNFLPHFAILKWIACKEKITVHEELFASTCPRKCKEKLHSIIFSPRFCHERKRLSLQKLRSGKVRRRTKSQEIAPWAFYANVTLFLSLLKWSGLNVLCNKFMLCA